MFANSAFEPVPLFPIFSPENLMVNLQDSSGGAIKSFNNHEQGLEARIRVEREIKTKARDNEIRMGRWSEKEHKLFLEAMERYGNSWNQVQAYVKTRTTLQIRSHAQKFYAGLTQKAIKKYKEGPNKKQAIFVVVREYLNTTTIKESSKKKQQNLLLT